MTTYRAMWEDVPQLDVSGEDLLEVLRRTENDYEAFAFDPADDPDYLTPELRWALGWNADGKRRRLVLFKDGTVTGVHIDEVPADNAARQCAEAGHPMAFYRPVRNDSVCECNQACELGDFRNSQTDPSWGARTPEQRQATLAQLAGDVNA